MTNLTATAIFRQQDFCSLDNVDVYSDTSMVRLPKFKKLYGVVAGSQKVLTQTKHILPMKLLKEINLFS